MSKQSKQAKKWHANANKESKAAKEKLESQKTKLLSGPVNYLKAHPDVQTCPICNGPMKLKEPRPNDQWSAFWGCVNFKITGCKGSKKVE